ncbi:MAG TPA: hypothetical protein VGF63_08095 [Solirubrobacteraceae bacterium]|jgi:hypothetical protein
MPNRSTRSSFLLAIGLLAPLAGCGGGSGSASTAPRPSALTSAVPALAKAPAKAGELVFKGQASPADHGPVTLDGTYLVRFEQIAPEDPKLDFSGQTPFTAELQRSVGDESGAVKLFETATATGRRTVKLHGRYVLDVSYGDFPYAVRFTPRR